MIKSYTKFLKLLLVLGVFLGFSQESSADYPRNTVILQYTSTTCPPCAAYNPAFHAWLAQNRDYVIPLVFHTNYPAPGDPMYTINPTFNQFFINAAGNPGIPAASINGAATINPGGLPQSNYLPITQFKGTTSPAKIDVELSREGTDFIAKITVTSTQALNNYLLRGIVVEEDIKYSSAPGSNGETEFPWVPRTSVIDNATYSVPVTLAANETKTFTYKFNRNSQWQSGGFYVAAYIQNTGGNKEIIQGGESEKLFGVNATATSKYLKAAPGEQIEFSFQVENKNAFAIDNTISIDNTNSKLPNGWTVELSKSDLTLNAGGKSTIKATITPKKGANGIGTAIFNIIPESKSNGGGDFNSISVNVLNTDTELGIYYVNNGQADRFKTSLNQAENYKSVYAAVPLDVTEAVTAYSPSDFKYIMIVENQSTQAALIVNQNFTTMLNTAATNKKNIAVLSSWGGFISLARNSTNTGYQYNVPQSSRDLFLKTFGVELLGSFNLLNNNQLSNLATIGVSGDPISNDMSFSINSGYSQTSPFYTSVVPALKINNTAETKPCFVVNTQDGNTIPIGVRREANGSKLVYLGFEVDALGVPISNATLIRKILEYIAPITTTPVDKPLIAVSTTKLDFGKLKVGNTKSSSFTINNEGKADLIIDEIRTKFENEAYVIKNMPTLPNTIVAGGSIEITVEFTPTELGENSDFLEIISNSEIITTEVEFKGEGTAEENNKPIISASTDFLAFGGVKVGQSKELTISFSNIGVDPLSISQINLSLLDGFFEILNVPSLPLNIAAGAKYDVKIKFTPDAVKNYTNSIVVRSNSDVNSNYTIPISGLGETASSVKEDGIAGDLSLFSYNVGPNPIESQSTITYTVASNVGAQNVVMNLVDSRGTVVRNILNSEVEVGTYSIDINSAGIASGNYLLVATVNGNSYNLPVIIKK